MLINYYVIVYCENFIVEIMTSDSDVAWNLYKIIDLPPSLSRGLFRMLDFVTKSHSNFQFYFIFYIIFALEIFSIYISENWQQSGADMINGLNSTRLDFRYIVIKWTS